MGRFKVGMGAASAAGLLALGGLLPASAATPGVVAAAISGSLTVSGTAGITCVDPSSNVFGAGVVLDGAFVDSAANVYVGDVPNVSVTQTVNHGTNPATGCVGPLIGIGALSGTFSSGGLAIVGSSVSGSIGASTGITVGATAVAVLQVTYNVNGVTTNTSTNLVAVIQAVPVPPAFSTVELAGAVAGVDSATPSSLPICATVPCT